MSSLFFSRITRVGNDLAKVGVEQSIVALECIHIAVDSVNFLFFTNVHLVLIVYSPILNRLCT